MAADTGFPWTVADYDEQMIEEFRTLMIDARAALNQRAHAEIGVPLKSRTQIELAELEHEIEQRELRKRAQAGDPDALAYLALQAAELEILADDVDQRNAAIETALNGRPGEHGRVDEEPPTTD